MPDAVEHGLRAAGLPDDVGEPLLRLVPVVGMDGLEGFELDELLGRIAEHPDDGGTDVGDLPSISIGGSTADRRAIGLHRQTHLRSLGVNPHVARNRSPSKTTRVCVACANVQI